MPLNKAQANEMMDKIWVVLDAYEPPMTVDERNGLSYSIQQSIKTYVTADAPPPPPKSIKVVDIAWPTPELLPRSATQQGACQFRFTVATNEVPRPGRLTAAPAGAAGGNDNFFYKWSKEPHADAEGGTQDSAANFQVGKAGYGQTVMPGETWYVAVKMEGGNTGGKFVGELAVNAPN